ncbi:hypothetical protein SAMN05192556_10448 [Halomonas caseinilytica]|uniref:Uncharacterized protein n=1 Tax=Halomonas caseinilytica TaxID=438744 RepID=A0A1M6TTB2_9GAMM|nr:hypothetical protein SAMN05192556_10448 [Halomonas caseinilytica]
MPSRKKRPNNHGRRENFLLRYKTPVLRALSGKDKM